ncbi:phosphoadenylyl-sulfate reductase [Roseinatronobacter sp.]|uniref:phosphoadenylyl-sulfate reductase n=1 Tax=Roseinatronobacter sp. TaxID=1945755 RepID=UPI0025E1AA70|nr:phosphoadenylyl-sulfate reductase [Rhodobaca sp.]
MRFIKQGGGQMQPDPQKTVGALLTKPDPLSAQQFLAEGIARLNRVAMVSSFGADSAVLLHMVAQIDRALPVLFIDTLALFPETVAYQRALAAHLRLSNVQSISPDRTDLFTRDPDGLLHRSDAESCCQLRKSEPLSRALQGYDGWITGRKRHQADTRALLQRAEVEPATGRIRLNPLADWDAQSVVDYLDAHDLPRHPLVAQGYPSIGCAPCTTRVNKGEDPRAGRWRGSAKTECGIHFTGGVPRPIRQEDAA